MFIEVEKSISRLFSTHVIIFEQDLKEITVNKTNCLYEDLLVPDISDDGIKNLVGNPLKNTLGRHLLGPLDAVARASSSKFVFSLQRFIICDHKSIDF